MRYEELIERKTQLGNRSGFKPHWIPDWLFDFQQFLTTWAVEQGCGAVFADTGTGKTLMELVWGQNVVMETNRPVLLLTPLAVGPQTLMEAEARGIPAVRSQDGKPGTGITITNYQRLHYFNPNDFAGVIADESSAIKSFEGETRKAVTEFMRKIKYRSLWTATAAPNDYIELGTSSEALGELGYMDMLMRFFKNDTNSISATRSRRFEKAGKMFDETGKWRFRGHAEIPFWRWVCSWARAMRKPSDLGFNDDGFILPPLIEREHLVETELLAEGMLFATPAVGLKEQRKERRRSIGPRCEKMAELMSGNEQALIWCHLNDEGDLLEELMPDCKQVSGATPDEEKEETFTAFARGELPKLVTKGKIAAWGLNLQSCHRVGSFPSHSYEQHYQGIRRCWRFGQKHPVTVDIVTTEGELNVLANLRRKSDAADKMFARLVELMNESIAIERGSKFDKQATMPAWI